MSEEFKKSLANSGDSSGPNETGPTRYDFLRPVEKTSELKNASTQKIFQPKKD